MSQHDYNLSNQSGAACRSDLNLALAAILSNNSSTIAPSTTAAYMWHADSSSTVMKVRNPGDTAFINVFKMTSSSVQAYSAGVLLSSPVQKTANNTFTKSQRGAIVSVTYASSVVLDLNAGNNYHLSNLTGNLTLANPSAITSAAGQGGSIWLKQDGTGSRTVSFGTMFKFPAGTAPTASTASGTTDRVDYKVRNASTVDSVYTTNVS